VPHRVFEAGAKIYGVALASSKVTKICRMLPKHNYQKIEVNEN
jgi:hypothetical protein